MFRRRTSVSLATNALRNGEPNTPKEPSLAENKYLIPVAWIDPLTGERLEIRDGKIFSIVDGVTQPFNSGYGFERHMRFLVEADGEVRKYGLTLEQIRQFEQGFKARP